jgi:hypothetical protein
MGHMIDFKEPFVSLKNAYIIYIYDIVNSPGSHIPCRCLVYIAVVYDMYLMVMLAKERRKCIPVGFFYNETR